MDKRLETRHYSYISLSGPITIGVKSESILKFESRSDIDMVIKSAMSNVFWYGSIIIRDIQINRVSLIDSSPGGMDAALFINQRSFPYPSIDPKIPLVIYADYNGHIPPGYKQGDNYQFSFTLIGNQVYAPSE